MSNNYDNLNGRQVIAYSDDKSKDAFGIRGVKYVVRNADGTYSQPFSSESEMQTATGLIGKNQ